MKAKEESLFKKLKIQSRQAVEVPHLSMETASVGERGGTDAVKHVNGVVNC